MTETESAPSSSPAPEITNTGTATAGTATIAAPAAAPAADQAKPAGLLDGAAEAKPGLLDTVDAGYEIKSPEGRELDGGFLSEYTKVAKELGVKAKDAQAMLDRIVPAIAAREEARTNELANQFAEQTRADKEFGGVALEQNLSMAKKAVDAFAGPELKELLKGPLQNHVGVLKFLAAVGRSISADRLVTGKPAAAISREPTNEEIAQAMYGQSTR